MTTKLYSRANTLIYNTKKFYKDTLGGWVNE